MAAHQIEEIESLFGSLSFSAPVATSSEFPAPDEIPGQTPNQLFMALEKIGMVCRNFPECFSVPYSTIVSLPMQVEPDGSIFFEKKTPILLFYDASQNAIFLSQPNVFVLHASVETPTEASGENSVDSLPGAGFAPSAKVESAIIYSSRPDGLSDVELLKKDWLYFGDRSAILEILTESAEQLYSHIYFWLINDETDCLSE